MANILIIDDDRQMSAMLSEMLAEMGHNAVSVDTGDRGMNEALRNPYDIVFLDVQLPDGSGLDILPRIRQTLSSPEVIILTGHANMDGAEIAIKNGAWDYVQKKDSPKKLLLQLKRVIQYRNELKNRQRYPVALNLEGIVGNSPEMRHCYDLIAQAVGNDVNIHLSGETGTGKELFARAIHLNSKRKQNLFVVVDCASLPETLIESTLFGHTKGAFTGAHGKRKGLIALAHKGTLFLDEIGELPLHIQKVLLRVIQERSFLPVGSESEVKSDFRLISATNRDLDRASEAGKFRKDLLFRLRSLEIHLPPLRERAEDIKELTFYYLNNLCQNFDIKPKAFSPELIEMMTAYSWPGNVRELIRALETAISAAHEDRTLFPIHLPVHIRTKAARNAIEPAKSVPGTGTEFSKPYPKMRELLENTEQRYLRHLMAENNGNVKEVSRITGISSSRLYDRLKKYKIGTKNYKYK